MKDSLKNKVKYLESKVGSSDIGDVVFQINGQNEEGEQLDTMVVVNDEVMVLDDFNAKYPNFKPNGISIIVGEWQD